MWLEVAETAFHRIMTSHVVLALTAPLSTTTPTPTLPVTAGCYQLLRCIGCSIMCCAAYQAVLSDETANMIAQLLHCKDAAVLS